MGTKVTTVMNAPRGWKADPQFVYIGRAGGVKNDPLNCMAGEDGYFGNPFKLKKGEDRGSTIKRYRQYLYERLKTDGEFERLFYELKDKTLVCFCRPGLCHGGVMADVLDNLQVI